MAVHGPYGVVLCVCVHSQLLRQCATVTAILPAHQEEHSQEDGIPHKPVQLVHL